MNRRSIFKTIAGLLAAPFVPFVKPKPVASVSGLDRWFIDASDRVRADVAVAVQKRGRICNLLEKGPLPRGMGETKRAVSLDSSVG
jgi:hypothetical protein